MSVPTTAVFLNKTTPAAPANRQNVVFATDNATPQQSITASDPDFVGDTGSGGLGGNVPPPPPGSAAAGFVLRADGTFGLPPALGGSMNFKGPWSSTAVYAEGDVTTDAGEAWLCISPVDGSIVPAFVQSKAQTNGTTVMTLVSNVTAGNLIAVYLASHSSSVNPSAFALTDSLGTVYTTTDIAGGGGTFQNGGVLFFGVAPASGSCTITATGMSSQPAMAAIEFAGVTDIVDAHTAAVNVDSVSLTTSRGAMIVAAFSNGQTGDTFVGSSGVTAAVQSNTDKSIVIGYRSVGSAGTYTPGFTVTGSDSSPLCFAAAFLDGSLSPDLDSEHWLALGAPAVPVMVGDSGSGGIAGLVPAPAAGDAAAGKFLKADGTWTAPPSSPITIGFGVTNGSVANATGPGRLTASRAGTISRCVVTVNASDGVTALTIRIKKNGIDIFTSDMTVAAGTAAGTVQISTSLTSTPLPVALHDVFTIDITSGATAWNFTAQLEG
jgi:hypothetical protein